MKRFRFQAMKRQSRRIKRFLEDEENLSKSAQKIVKTRQAAALIEEEEAA
jgi:V/A-type H+/Na+-transporting ATPase subunit D